MHRFICIAANCFVCLFFDFVAIPVTVKLLFMVGVYLDASRKMRAKFAKFSGI